ncbi:MAG: hypothetical protein JWN86_4039 [Planctomycetota bacterium]|nr:hypothetical protein [Planctomycetota bacterium]
MASALRKREARSCGPAEQPAGFRILIPGYPQWLWRQRERSAALAGTYAAAMAVGLFAWGSRIGLAMIVLAFLAHVSSAADVIRQGAFPGFGRWVPSISASFGLGLGCYAPALALASVLAWPERPIGADHERYAINRWAFLRADPEPGDWVFYHTSDGGGFGLGRLVARAGHSVEWSPNSLQVDGQVLALTPSAPDGEPLELSMTIPDDQILVAPMADRTAGATSSSGLILVPRSGVIGRPWARLYPVWTRRLLF